MLANLDRLVVTKLRIGAAGVLLIAIAVLAVASRVHGDEAARSEPPQKISAAAEPDPNLPVVIETSGPMSAPRTTSESAQKFGPSCCD